ncbi:MAG TPA: SAF domain-containing protein [Acidimicrobiales bacterium]|nr:SAF domain-containing protein [Acidimicrobiales bacterium]
MAGAFLVAAAMVAVVAAWLSAGAPATTAYVVAARDLPPGARLEPEDLTTEALSLPAGGLGGLAYRSPTGLLGRVLAAPLRAGALVQAGDVAVGGGADGLRPVVASVPSGDATVLSVGDPVDVLVTTGDGAAAQTDVVVTGARVLALDRGASGLAATDATVEVTLGVSSLTQVTAVVHAARTGAVSVVVGAPGDRTSSAGGAAPGAGTGSAGAGGSGDAGAGSGASGTGTGTGTGPGGSAGGGG